MVLDHVLYALLADDFDLVFPLPPIVPAFAAETVRPGAP